MCGIFLYLNNSDEQFDISKIITEFMKIQHRGPNNSQIYIENNLVVGFHRLAINDLTLNGNQPMFMHDVMLTCNGEIYNFKELIEKYDLKCQSHSDCETIIKLYNHLYEVHNGDINATMYEICNCLDGEFAFIIYDHKNNKIIVARDRYGVRSLFYSYHKDTKKFAIASELKAIDQLIDNVEQFKPSSYMILDMETFEYNIKKYNIISEPIVENAESNLEVIIPNIKNLLIQAVKNRVSNTERPMCCLLSGGLDSSLICGIVSKWFLKDGKKLDTFSIGMKDSTDLRFAKKVADFIGSDHHEVLVTKEEMLYAIEETIRVTETYDITTIRASTPHRLLAKYIKKNTDFKCILSGEMSDELGFYLYFKKAPNSEALHNESNRLLEELYLFDNLRADKSISANGLEARVPFSDHKFVKYIQSIDPKLRMSNDKIEKYLLRKAFENDNILPNEVLYRPKTAFSDGCSSEEDSWYIIIQKYIDTIISDEEFTNESIKYQHCQPKTKESYYYRKIYNKYYKSDKIIPHFWLPKWCGDEDIIDPSARTLEIYVPEK